ncbi:MAG: STAS domain-containing protein [Vicingaceae bacterium]|nr:STAS domain-containing protein [Vicingaceae bacterium]
MSFSFHIKKENNVLIIALNGSLNNKQQAENLLEEIDFYFNEGVNSIILDLAEMEYMNSSGLGIFISILTQTRNRNGEVVVINIPKKINQLLVITKLNHVFNIAHTIEEAKQLVVKDNNTVNNL